MTFIHYLLLILVSAGISGFNIYYLRSGIKSPSLFYFCSIYLLFIVTLPFASDLYSYFFNEILDLPDARISILALFSFSMSIVNIYLLAKQAKQARKLRILNRDFALLSYKLDKLNRTHKN